MVGASGGGSTTVLFPSALNAYAGAKIKIVRGYKGTTDIILAMERGEVDIVGAYGLPGMLVSHPGWVDKGEAEILYRRRSSGTGCWRTCRRCRSSRTARRAAWSCAPSPAPARSAARSSRRPACRRAARRAAQGVRGHARGHGLPRRRPTSASMMLDPGTGEEMDAIVQETLRLPAGDRRKDRLRCEHVRANSERANGE